MGNFAQFADVQNKKITTASCNQRGYAEGHKGDTSGRNNVLDFFVGG